MSEQYSALPNSREGYQIRDMAQSHTIRTTAATLALLSATGALLAGCGEPQAVPMNDEFTSNTGGSESSNGSADTQGNSNNSAKGNTGDTNAAQDTGVYKDGTYDVAGQYGPVGEDTIDVHVTVQSGNISDVSIVGHPFTSISKEHQDNFASNIGTVVVGKPLKGLHVDTVAGASWTTEAFNTALDTVRQQASERAEQAQ